MKRAVSIILCACFLAIALQGQETKPAPRPKDDMTLCELVFVLAITVTASCVVITLYGKCPGKNDPVMVYIDKSTDGRASWNCIRTNGPIVLNGTDPLEVFKAQLTDDLALYRARVKRCVTP